MEIRWLEASGLQQLLIARGIHPTAMIYEAQLEMGSLIGRCVLHSKQVGNKFADGHRIHTSKILSHILIDGILLLKTSSHSLYAVFDYSNDWSMMKMLNLIPKITEQNRKILSDSPIKRHLSLVKEARNATSKT